METTEDDDDLQLVKASAALLADLESSLPKVLWKRHKSANTHGKVHSRVKTRDIGHLVRLIDSFQGDPQLLDARLKYILPPIIEAYIESLDGGTPRHTERHLDFESAACSLLYVLCKVRGYKVVLGFLNNEPRYLEPILSRLEEFLANQDQRHTQWETPYVLLLWLSHLLLTPFDLSTISDRRTTGVSTDERLPFEIDLPPIAERVLLVGLKYLPTSTKAQDAAATLLVRLVVRPDMQELLLADTVVLQALEALQKASPDGSIIIYEKLGPLRFLAGVASAAELGHILPSVYQACQNLVSNDDSPVLANAVATKLMVKIFRNIVVLSLRPTSSEDRLAAFAETNGILEDVIDYLLRALGDRDTPVRYAAARALSLIILQLEPQMGHEVIEAILDSFQEDMSRKFDILDFRSANPLRWHGLTLALSHTLFKRSSSPMQLPQIVHVLVSALQFEQRTATGSSIGTNVRDAANFGIWSVSRRYTTQELLSVDVSDITAMKSLQGTTSVIQWLATQLILSACLDPAGNIRRGSSAALQELIGRHPNEVYDGIALVQIVDYQAVGLRRRAMLDVANRAAQLHATYWAAVSGALFKWRGLGSSDVPSREAAAASLAKLSLSTFDEKGSILRQVTQQLLKCAPNDSERLHGLVLSLAALLQDAASSIVTTDKERTSSQSEDLGSILNLLATSTKEFSLRLIHSDLPVATAQMLAALCQCLVQSHNTLARLPLDLIDTLTERLLARSEDSILQALPAMVQHLHTLKHKLGLPPGCLDISDLWRKVTTDSEKSTLHGAGRAIALGTLFAVYSQALQEEELAAASALATLVNVANVDWRIVGVKSLRLAIETRCSAIEELDTLASKLVARAVHTGLNDYTIDERGDVGSLVRLQAISCTSCLFATSKLTIQEPRLRDLYADILRLSLEKLDRVRLAAAQCRFDHFGMTTPVTDVASVSTEEYFHSILEPLSNNEAGWESQALLEGVISCAGISAEPLLQASRAALASILASLSDGQLHKTMTIFANVLKSLLDQTSNNIHPALELFAFLLAVQIPQRLTDETGFKWRNLLSTVQKSHHKSNDIPRILAALRVYQGLADVPSVRQEVLKKLISMLKTNPYPKVRSAVAEVLFVVTGNAALKDRDWMKPPSQHAGVLQEMTRMYVDS